LRTRLFFICAVILLFISAVAACKPAAEEVDVRDEVVYYLVKMNEAAVAKMDLEADSIGQELYPVMEKLAKPLG